MSLPPQDSSRSGAAFSLLELLVALAIVAALVSLGLIGAGSFVRRAQEAKCQGNLRQAGAALFAYAADHNMRLLLFSYKDAGSSLSWYEYLSGHVTADHKYSSTRVGPAYLQPSDSLVCPAFTPKRYDNASRKNTYGSRVRDLNDPASFSPPDLSTQSAGVVLSAVESPGSYWLLSDSYHRDKKSQIYIVQRTASSVAGMHFRHQNRAHILYADGHVKAEDFETMSTLPINDVRCAFDAEGNPMR